jgi:hypothetical protein
VCPTNLIDEEEDLLNLKDKVIDVLEEAKDNPYVFEDLEKSLRKT